MAIVERRVEILANNDDDYVRRYSAALPGTVLELWKFRVERVYDLPVSTFVIGGCIQFVELSINCSRYVKIPQARDPAAMKIWTRRMSTDP